MRANIVIFEPLGLHLAAGVGNRAEQVRIEAFITEASIETLHMGLVCGLARVTEFNAEGMLICPGVQCFARELWSIVHMQQTRQMVLFTQSFKHRHDAIARE